MTPENQALPNEGLLLIVSGPSGVGKTTIARHIESALDGVFSVSMTTRPKAASDVEGVDYHYVQPDEFDQIRSSGELLEWAKVFGHLYGTPKKPLAAAMSSGKTVILEIDVQGAIQVKDKSPDCFAIFILPPNESALLDRLRARSREDEDAIQRRFARAKDEITQAQKAGIYNAFIINDDLNLAKARAEELARNALASRQNAKTQLS